MPSDQPSISKAGTAVHHDSGQSYIAVFDQPVEDVHAIAVLNDDPGEVVYLDAELKVISTEQVAKRDSQRK